MIKRINKKLLIIIVVMIGFMLNNSSVKAIPGASCRYEASLLKMENVGLDGSMFNSVYTMHSIDNSVSINYSNGNFGYISYFFSPGPGVTFCVDYEPSYIYKMGAPDLINQISSLIPDDIMLNEYTNINDMDAAKGINKVVCNDDNTNCYKEVYIPFVIEETVTPDGYIKTDNYVLLQKLKLNFSLSNNTFNKEILFVENENNMYIYDENYDYANINNLSETEMNKFRNKYHSSLLSFNTNQRFGMSTSAIISTFHLKRLTPEIYFGKLKNIDNNGNVLNSAKFKIHNIDNSISFDYTNEDGIYYANKKVYGVNIFSAEEMGRVNDTFFKSNQGYDELMNLYDNVNSFDEAKQHEILICDDYSNCQKTIYIPYIVEETMAPKGFKKADKYVALYGVTLNFDYICMIGSTPRFEKEFKMNDPVYLKYDENYDYSTINDLSEEELNAFIQKYSTDVDYDDVEKELIITNYPGKTDFKISSSIDGKNNINIKVGKKLRYNVLVNNIGTTGLYDNVIKVELPKGLKYVAGSANKGGTYDEESNTVIWNSEYIDESEEAEYTFEVEVLDVAPKYKVKASIVSGDINKEVTSNDVEINVVDSIMEVIIVEIGNTLRKIPLFILIICGVLLAGGIGFFTYSFIKSKKELKKTKNNN